MTKLAIIRNTAGPELPPLIAGAGDSAVRRFLEFFTVNVRNKNTRAAHARAARDFLRWCEGQGIGELGRVQPVHVAGHANIKTTQVYDRRADEVSFSEIERVVI